MDKIKTKTNENLLIGLQRRTTKRVVLLYSGGIDSTATGLILREEGYSIYPLFINYGQSALEAEKMIVENVPLKLGFNSCRIIETDLMKQLDITNVKIVSGHEAFDDTSAWVPGRNTLFMIIAGIYAKQIDADGIAIGYILDDNFVFGDNDYFHHKGIEEILSKTFLQPMQVFLPTRSMRKKELIELLNQSNFLDLTVSCWNAKIVKGKIKSCNKCTNCREREKSIIEVLK